MRSAARTSGQAETLEARAPTSSRRSVSVTSWPPRRMVSAWPKVRAALRQLQLSFRRAPGLVADGRDMGTVIFPGAQFKVFLTASAATRAERRYKQLISKGISANIDGLRADLEARDARDQTRPVAPLRPADDAMLLDNSALTVQASVEAVLEVWQQRRPFD